MDGLEVLVGGDRAGTEFAAEAGTVRVSSTVGAGVTFEFLVPVAVPADR